jgi:hypothetical protein
VVPRNLLRGHLADRHPGYPGQLAAIIRGRRGIEDRLHWVRDMDFDEDRSQIRTASGPQIMASLCNLVVTILRLAGAASIAAALRYHARRPGRPLQTIMRCVKRLCRSPGRGRFSN